MTLEEIKQYHTIAIEVAEAGGKVLRDNWNQVLQIREKSAPGDLVTQVDQLSEDVVISAIREHYPTHAILSEESGMHKTQEEDFLWVIDPLDGTTNYTHHHPMVAVAVALLYQGKPIVGVVYNPIYNELFEAAKGHGARLNGAPISVTETLLLPKSLLATGFAYDRTQTPNNNYAQFCHMTSLSQGVRRGGSAALDLAFVAAGRLDGFWERGLQPWDIAAGAILGRRSRRNGFRLRSQPPQARHRVCSRHQWLHPHHPQRRTCQNLARFFLPQST